jgi:predicted O-methyltransferase YrrM
MLWRRWHPNAPWLTPQAILILEQLLRSSDVVVESGSGRSTKWFLERCARLYSIETSFDYYLRVRADIKRENLLSKLTYGLIFSFEDVIAFVNAYVPLEVDVILIDGAYRVETAGLLIDRLKSGGILIFDNVNVFHEFRKSNSPGSLSERKTGTDHSELFERIGKWRHLILSNGITDTGIFIKL